MTKIYKVKSTKIRTDTGKTIGYLPLLFTLFVIVPLFTMGGCNQGPRAFSEDNAFLTLASAGIPSNINVINFPVRGSKDLTLYRYAFGPKDSTDCNSATSYTPWRSMFIPFYMNLNSSPDGALKLCLLGKGVSSEDGSTLEQPLTGPTVYEWVKDSTAPGAFAISAPVDVTIDTQDIVVEVTESAGADAYDIKVGTDQNCANPIAGAQSRGDDGRTLPVSLPSEGTYFICAEAWDDASNMTAASNSGASFTVSIPEEVTVKDHVTDASCWDTDSVFNHFNGPSEADSIAAATFIGQGGILKRVGGIFVDSNCSDMNSGIIENMNVSVAFYENKDVFISDPFLTNQPVNSRSKRYPAVKMHTDPEDPKYFLNPVRVSPSGTQQFFIDVDASSLNIQTTEGQEHLVALWFSSESASDGSAWMVFSRGCAGQVGALSDYYKSNIPNAASGPGTFQSLNAAHNFGAYLVTELK